MYNIPIKPNTAEADVFDWAYDAMIDHFQLEGLGNPGQPSFHPEGASLYSEDAVYDMMYRLEETLYRATEAATDNEAKAVKRDLAAARRVVAKIEEVAQ